MKKLLLAVTLTVMLIAGSMWTGENLVHAAAMPHAEEMGALTPYKNFIRGEYAMCGGTTCELLMEWNEGGTVEVRFKRGEEYTQVLTVQSGVPLVLQVPADGLYRFHVPLDGSEITGMTFSVGIY